MVGCPEFHVSCRLGREFITLPSYAAGCPWNHGLRPRKLYHSVAVTSALVRVPTQWPLVRSFMPVVGQSKNFSPCPRMFTFLYLLIRSIGDSQRVLMGFLLRHFLASLNIFILWQYFQWLFSCICFFGPSSSSVTLRMPTQSHFSHCAVFSQHVIFIYVWPLMPRSFLRSVAIFWKHFYPLPF